MRREPQIPLFLWVTAAIVAHLVGGEGATKVVERLEETLDIKSFASEVRRHAKSAGKPVEVSFIDEESEAPEPEDATEETEQDDAELPENDEPTEDTPDTDFEKPEEKAEEEVDAPIEKPEEVEKEEPKEEEKAKPVAEKEKAPDLTLPTPQPPKPPPPPPDRRVAVDQHVEDKNQEDNPTARLAGEHANRVEEETRARITANDADTSSPVMAGPSAGAGEDPGNSTENELAQSEESPGRKDRIAGDPDPSPQDQRAQAQAQSQAGQQANQAASSAQARAASPGQSGQKAQEARAATQAQDAVAETLNTPGGSFSVAKAQEASAAQRAQKAREARAGSRHQSTTGALGLGSQGLTKNGVNLNLSHSSAQAIVGADKIASIRKAEGERRLSQHRGKWQSMGLERWKPALENYVASVKVGNQTALNTARVPFAAYLNHIHQRLHEIYAHGFLGHLDQLPPDHPLNNPEMSTHLEIALSREDGRIVKMGITKSSGVTAFDVGALESVEKAGPYGVPPGAIVSADGNVYLHWEFHRKPMYACSTYFARPYIISDEQKTAPPRVDPPKPPSEDGSKKQNQRSGSRSPGAESQPDGHQG